MKNKCGEITTQQIVILVILIVSFAVILIFLFLLNPGDTTEKEVCYNSVVMKSVPGSSLAGSLNCKRDYICITKDGSCEGLTKPEVIEVKNLDEVYYTLSEQMADCWWMFGEGKIDYVGKDYFKKDNYCSICDQVLFDDSLRDLEGVKDDKISKDALYDYMGKTKVKGKEITYSKYIYGTDNINQIKVGLSTSQGKDVSFGSIQVGKQYINVMGITGVVAGRGWKIAAATVAGVIVAFIPVVGTALTGFIAGAIIVGAGEYGTTLSPEVGAITVKGNGIDNEFMAPTIIEVDSNEFKALNCYDIETLS